MDFARCCCCCWFCCRRDDEAPLVSVPNDPARVSVSVFFRTLCEATGDNHAVGTAAVCGIYYYFEFPRAYGWLENLARFSKTILSAVFNCKP